MVQEANQDGHLETMETDKDQTDESCQAGGEEIQSLGVGKYKKGLLVHCQQLYP